MAVYTELDKVQIEGFLERYDCGKLLSFEGILQGVENTNYKIVTDKNKFILTIFEQRTNISDLPFFFDFMEHLKGRGIDCPSVLDDKKGVKIQSVSEKSAALFSFLEGHNVSASQINAQLCFEMGDLLARMHKASESFRQTRANSMSLTVWCDLLDKINSVALQDSADEIPENKAFNDLVSRELERAEETLRLDLPKGVVHADAFPDNIFMRDNHIEGVIDFYFSATDYLVYDLAIAVNAWCFEDGEINYNKFDRFIAGYETVRSLSSEERMHFSDFARAASLRILMTRAHDKMFHDPANLVTPKNPLEYKRILEFHGQKQLFS